MREARKRQVNVASGWKKSKEAVAKSTAGVKAWWASLSDAQKKARVEKQRAALIKTIARKKKEAVQCGQH